MPDPVLFIFDDSPEGKVLIKTGEEPSVPEWNAMNDFPPLLAEQGRVHRADDSDRWALLRQDAATPDGYAWVSRRDLPMHFDYSLFVRAGAAFQMRSLRRNNRFCGVCGAEMSDHERENARWCPACGQIVFPSLSPAVIMAVEKDGMLLMGHGVNFPAGRYSVLAGFVEPGETLEEAVAREVFEESRVLVGNIRYFGSQPWPFPNSMMFGFLADWLEGDPTPDAEEVTDVRWFRPDEMPTIPPSVSIARRLIDDWLRRQAID